MLGLALFLMGAWIAYVDLILVPIDYDQCDALLFDTPGSRFNKATILINGNLKTMSAVSHLLEVF